MENLDKQRFVFCLGAHFGLSPSTSCYSIIPIILVGFNATRHMLEHTQLVLPTSPDVLAPLLLLSLSLSFSLYHHDPGRRDIREQRLQDHHHQGLLSLHSEVRPESK